MGLRGSDTAGGLGGSGWEGRQRPLAVVHVVAHARVPVAGVVGTDRRLLRPTPEEGFDELWHATATPEGDWRIEPLAVTPPLF